MNDLKRFIETGKNIIVEKIDDVKKDATPRTLYVYRNVTNAKDIIAWAKGQGFEATLPASDMHVTVCYSKRPVDWMQIPENYVILNGEDVINVPASAVRVIEKFGEAAVLCFNSAQLAHRHEDIKRVTGATWDYEEYQPHITISYNLDSSLIENIEPYRGKIVLGPEIFEEIDDNHKVEEE